MSKKCSKCNRSVYGSQCNHCKDSDLIDDIIDTAEDIIILSAVSNMFNSSNNSSDSGSSSSFGDFGGGDFGGGGSGDNW